MLPFITTTHNDKNNTYTFRGLFGSMFRNYLNKNILSKKKVALLFRSLSNTEVTIDSFFLLELREILIDILNNDHGFNIRVNARSMQKMLEEIEKNTWLRRDGTGTFALDKDAMTELFQAPAKQYQLDSFTAYEDKKNRFGQFGLLLDAATGVGKTYMGMSIAAGCRNDINVIVCPLDLVESVWMSSFTIDPGNLLRRKLDRNEIYISTEFDKKKYNGEKWIIVHYEALNKFKDMLPTFGNKTFTFVVDEVHNFTAKDSVRKNLLLDVFKISKSKDRLLMSGTTIKGSNLEMVQYLDMLDEKFTPIVKDRFKKIYATPNELLKRCMQLRYKDISIKIKKEELNLEPVVYKTIEVTLPDGDRYTLPKIKEVMLEYSRNRFAEINSNMDKYKSKYEELITLVKAKSTLNEDAWRQYESDFKDVQYYYRKRLLIQYPHVMSRCSKFEKENILPHLQGQDKQDFKDSSVILKYPAFKVNGEVLGKVFMRLRMECHRDMASAIDYDFINSTLAKSIIVSSSIETIEAANKKIASQGFKYVTVYGKNSKNVGSIIESFKNDETINPLTGTYPNIAVGHHLVVANLVAILDLPFRTWLLDQVLARVNRLGQKKQIVAVYTKLNTGDEYNINSRNIDILKWAKTTVEEVTGYDVVGLDFEDAVNEVVDSKFSLSNEELKYIDKETNHSKLDEDYNYLTKMLTFANEDFILDDDVKIKEIVDSVTDSVNRVVDISNITWKNKKTDVTDKEFSYMESMLGIKFPSDFRNIVIDYNGSETNKINFDTKSNKGNIINYLLSFNLRDDGNILDANDFISSKLTGRNDTIIPIMGSYDGNYICYSFGSSVSIQYYNRLNNELIYVADSFTSFINLLYDEEKNKENMNKLANIKPLISFNKSDYLAYAYSSDYMFDIEWYQEMVTIIEDEGKYKYTEIKGGIKYVFIDGKSIATGIPIKVPILNVTDTIKVNKNLLSCLKDNIFTSVGIFISNVLFIEFPMKGVMTYKNRPFSHGEISNDIAKLLSKGTITVAQYHEYINAISFSLELNKLIVISVSKKMLVAAPGMDEFKRDLILHYDAKYGIKWKEDEALAIQFIGELKAFDNKFIKNDPTYGKLLSGKILNNSRPRKFMAFGVENGFGGNKPVFIINSLSDGYPKNKLHLSVAYNSARWGSYSRGSLTQLGGYQVKQAQRAVNHMVIEDGDCGDTIGENIFITESNAKIYKNLYIIENNKVNLVEDFKPYIGKTIKIRSVKSCRIKGNLCEVCAGKDASNYKDGISLMVINTFGIVLAISMSAMHKASKETLNFNIFDAIK